MTEYERLMRAILADPESDESRLRFAEHIRESEPDRAKFIELEIAWAKKDRSRADGLRYEPAGEPARLLKQHENEWSRTLAKYTTHIRYDRGFIAWIRIDPHVFLEYGEFLFANAPIAVVQFWPGDGAFPFKELAASPLLARLPAMSLALDEASQDDLISLLESPHLTSLQHFSRASAPYSDKSEFYYTRLAEIATVRKLIYFNVGASFPGERYQDTGVNDWWGAAVSDWTDMQPEGTALEQKYGYLAWLHPRENMVSAIDVRWYVEHRKRPVRPIGSRVSSP